MAEVNRDKGKARNYYNEFDPFAAAWLRELIKAGLIAPGEVDERSIEDVIPTDLAGFVQCHFFAGIGVWSYALRRAGWADDRPVWTGSCPCQPFSSAGKGSGFADERHLWPAFFHLVSQCRPVTVFGEQVASKDGLAWLDLVQADLESAGYACGAVDTPACGFGAPHIRQRLYWVADALPAGRPARRAEPGDRSPAGGSSPGGVADSKSSESWAGLCHRSQAEQRRDVVADNSATNRLADPECEQKHEEQQRSSKDEREWTPDGLGGCYPSGRLAHPVTVGRQQAGKCIFQAGRDGSAGDCAAGRVGNTISLDNSSRPGPTNGLWRDADWLFCRDGKWRAAQPGSFPLVNGATARVGRLRGYGNAIVATQAEEFIRAYIAILLAHGDE